MKVKGDEEIRFESAANPTTDSKVLGTLSTDESYLIRHCVGRNPSTSPAILEELAGDSHAFVRGAVAENSVVSIKVLSQLLEDTFHFIQKKAEETLEKIAKSPDTEPLILEELSKFVDPRNPNAYPSIRCAVAENPNTPKETLKELSNLEIEKLYVAQNLSASAAILESLSCDENQNVRSTVARNPNSNLKILATLAKDHEEEVRIEVAENRSTEVKVLEMLVGEDSSDLKSRIITNPNVSIGILKKLLPSIDENDRLNLAESQYCSKDALTIFSKDSKPFFRTAVAKNPVTPGNLLDLLSRDEHEYVRLQVGGNLNSSQEILQKLCLDDSKLVRASVGGNPNASQDILKALSQDPYTEVRAAVGANQSADIEILRELATDAKQLVRLEAAGNIKTGSEVLAQLVNDPKVSVREAAAGNPGADEEVLKALCRSMSPSVRMEVARNPRAGQEILEIISKDVNKDVRWGVANNSHSSVEILSTLLIDESYIVREAAINTLITCIASEKSGIIQSTAQRIKILGQKRVFEYFDEAIRLCKNGAYQEGVNILHELAQEGHLDSIIELVYIFLDQEDFEDAKEIIDFYPDSTNSRILYLKAYVQEKGSSFDYKAYLSAAEAGSVNAALVLFEQNILSDREVAKRWLTRAKAIGHKDLNHYLEMWSFKPREKKFTIVIGRENNGSLTSIAVFRYDTEELLEQFNSIDDAIQFCTNSEGGFDFQEPYSEEFVPIFRVKIFLDSERIVIVENDHEYWFGDFPSDLDAAVEELLSRDCDWELIFYDSLPDEESE
jgi:HEAT repeat protein